MKKIAYCYHTHTFRCGHASGADEDYVLAAIMAGLTRLGFSDHVILPNIVQPNIRGDYSLFDGYIKSIHELKERYKDQIDIKVGFEAEYMEEFVPYYKHLLKSKKIDYLIMGQHCYYDGHVLAFYHKGDRLEGLHHYTKDVINGMKSGLFKYFAHPDFFMMISGVWDKETKKCAQEIIDASIKYNVPLEINLCQARAYGKISVGGTLSYIYPFIPFWQLVAKSKAHVVVGFDSHSPRHIYDPGLWIVEDIIQSTGVKIDYDFTL